ncbi:N-acetylmuramate alpha-1-phosphate uridylyltransferase MurU [Oceanospirillum sediminis]|uniref:Nucleotidyltransferase family protein n=1 Tax=Oceanospirillum sediminis TaxID=2760088 RepID=A0A839IUS9_9GAMM|nr:nucleotidyltransferase family protein [Oceanospirillum sediminis]MBB1488442.1 nucleotidyltransferase family protein [Oceanospirillum sediminis]
MQAMILAAGLGTRMRPLTDHTPKPMLNAAGKPLLAHQLERLIKAGVNRIVVNTSYLAEQIEDYIAQNHWPVDIALSYEPEPLETAGGLQQALKQGLLSDQEVILLVNGDIWCDYDLEQLKTAAAALSQGLLLAHLVLTDNPPHNPDGDFRLSEPTEEISQVQNKISTRQDNRCYTFSGISLIHPALIPMNQPPPIALGPLLRAATDQGQVSGEYYQGYWLDVGTPERLQQLSDYLEQNPAAG